MAKLNAIVIGNDLPKISNLEQGLLLCNCQVRGFSYDFANAVYQLNQLNKVLDFAIIALKEGDESWGMEIAALIDQQYGLPVILVGDNGPSDAVYNEIKRFGFFYVANFKPETGLHQSIDAAFQNFVSLKSAFAAEGNHYFLKESMIFNDSSGMEKIVFDQIRYIKIISSGVEVSSVSGIHKLPLSQGVMAQRIQKPYFVYCHESFLVNVKLVDSFTRDLLISGDQKIPIQEVYRDQVFNMFRVFDSKS